MDFSFLLDGWCRLFTDSVFRDGVAFGVIYGLFFGGGAAWFKYRRYRQEQERHQLEIKKLKGDIAERDERAAKEFREHAVQLRAAFIGSAGHNPFSANMKAAVDTFEHHAKDFIRSQCSAPIAAKVQEAFDDFLSALPETKEFMGQKRATPRSFSNVKAEKLAVIIDML